MRRRQEKETGYQAGPKTRRKGEGVLLVGFFSKAWTELPLGAIGKSVGHGGAVNGRAEGSAEGERVWSVTVFSSSGSSDAYHLHVVCSFPCGACQRQTLNWLGAGDEEQRRRVTAPGRCRCLSIQRQGQCNGGVTRSRKGSGAALGRDEWT